MRLLELFSGTGSVGRAFEAAGWEVTSLDADLRTPADIHADILTFDFECGTQVTLMRFGRRLLVQNTQLLAQRHECLETLTLQIAWFRGLLMP